MLRAVGEMKREYSAVPSDVPLATREHRASDFANIVRFCNANKLSLTKNGALSKASAIKLCKFCGYEEFAADVNAMPEDVRTAEGLMVTYPLTMACMIGGLLSVEDNACVPGGKAVAMLNLPHEQLIKKLFDAYLKSKSYDEISIMKGIKPKRGHNPALARQNLANELRNCPIGKAVYTYELERHLTIIARTFARKDARYIVDTGSDYYSYGTEWENYEHPLIFIILTFFGALGMIDIAWGEDKGRYSDRGRCLPLAFRINALGAYVLGMSGEYAAPEAPKTTIAGGFTVLPDYTIVVPESPQRLKHELFFERLFTRVSATREAAIYKLDFETIARALDSGTGVDELREYLQASDKPLPENVARALDDWQKQSGRVRLRQVTILECEDEALLEEVIRYKGMGDWVKDRVPAAVVIDGDAANKVKKTIEKNKRFCNNVL